MPRAKGTTGTSQSLERGLAILSSFHANRSLIGASELSAGSTSAGARRTAT